MVDSFPPFNPISFQQLHLPNSPSLQEENRLPDTDEWRSDQGYFKRKTSFDDLDKMEIEQDEMHFSQDLKGMPSDPTTQPKDGFKPEKISELFVEDVEIFIKKYDLLSDDPKRFLRALSLDPNMMEPHQSLFRFISFLWLSSGHNSSFNIMKMKWLLEVLCLSLFEDRIGYIPSRHLTKVLDFLSRRPWIFWKDPVTVFSVQRTLVPILQALGVKEILRLVLELIRQIDQADLLKSYEEDIKDIQPFKRFRHSEFDAYWTCDNQTLKSPFSLLSRRFIKINKVNANLEDICLAVKDFVNLNEKYVIIWEEGVTSGNGENMTGFLNLCNPDSWCRFMRNVNEFFDVRHYQPLLKQIYNSKRSQDINTMKTSSSLVSQKIQKLSIKHLGNIKDDPNSKRRYRKKSKYWEVRKNPILQEIAEYSRELMARQKAREWENFLVHS